MQQYRNRSYDRCIKILLKDGLKFEQFGIGIYKKTSCVFLMPKYVRELLHRFVSPEVDLSAL